MLKIENVMTRKAQSCAADETLECASRIMWDNDCGVVPVVDGGSRVIGMLTDRDICMAAYFEGRPLHELPISVAMSKNVYSVRPEDTIDKAERVMKENQVRRLPVTDADGRLVGILSLNDVAREAARERGQAVKEVSETGVAETLAAVCEPQHARALLRN